MPKKLLNEVCIILRIYRIKYQIIVNYVLSGINSELISNLFRGTEKRKQLLAINGSLISFYKVGDNVELMVIAVRQNPDNIKFIKPKYREIVLKSLNKLHNKQLDPIV